MTDKIPEAIVVLDRILDYLYLACDSDAQSQLDPMSNSLSARAYNLTERTREVINAFTAEHEALKSARAELANLPHSFAYNFTHLPKIDKALAAVENLP